MGLEHLVHGVFQRRDRALAARLARLPRGKHFVPQERGEKEIPSSVIGETLMRELHDTDPVAYVRFASVYRSFKDISEFMVELEELLKERKGLPVARPAAEGFAIPPGKGLLSVTLGV